MRNQKDVVEFFNTLLEKREFAQILRLAREVSVKSRRVALVEEISRYFCEEELRFYVDARSGLGRLDDDTISIADKLLGFVRDRTPASLVRLGDGEGIILGNMVKTLYPTMINQYQKLMCEIWFGKYFSKDSSTFVSEVIDALHSSLKNCDVIGIPTADRIQKEFGSNFRGYVGTTCVIKYCIENEHFFDSSIFSDCDLNVSLTTHGFFAKLFSQIGTCSVVTCHPELARCLEAKWMLKDVKSYLLPVQKNKASVLGDKVPGVHYPDIYEQLYQELTPREKGEVFLVGGGVLGKVYCGWIKERGGIAIDVGSMLDLWLGHQTRGLHPDKSTTLYESLALLDANGSSDIA